VEEAVVAYLYATIMQRHRIRELKEQKWNWFWKQKIELVAQLEF